MDIEYLKQDLIEALEGIDKDRLSLCDLKDYAEVVKIVSEIKGRDYSEIIAQMVTGTPLSGPGNYKALGPMTIKEMRGKGKEDREEDED